MAEETKEEEIKYFWFIEVKCCFVDDKEDEIIYTSVANVNLAFLKSYMSDSQVKELGDCLGRSIDTAKILEGVFSVCFTLIFWHDYYPVFVDYEKEKSFKRSEWEYAKKWLRFTMEKFAFFLNNDCSLKSK